MRHFLFLLSKAGLALAAVLLVSAAQAQRYTGEWRVSRGAGGSFDFTLADGKITGSLKDTGWERTTGERRSGKVTGTYTGDRFTLTIKYSTGVDSSFRGTLDRQSTHVFMTGIRYLNNKPMTVTRFTADGSRVGATSEDITGRWSGTFIYGPYRGHVTVQVRPDNSFSGTMESTKGKEWRIAGTIGLQSKKVRLNVYPGDSSQTYLGTYSVNPDGSVWMEFPKDEGRFTAEMTRD